MHEEKPGQAEKSAELWIMLECLLQLGKEQVAYKMFRLFMNYAFLDALRHAPVPVILTAFEYKPESLRSLLAPRIEKAWGTVAMAYRCEQYQLAQDCFMRTIKEHARHATEIAIRMANNKHQIAQLAEYLP